MSGSNEQDERFHAAHGPREATPVDAVELQRRYAPETASVRGILGFALGVIALLGIGFAITVSFVGVYEAGSERTADLEWVEPPPPGTNVEHWGNPQLDLQRLEHRERERLQTYGWIDRERGVIRIPIDEAMRQQAGR